MAGSKYAYVRNFELPDPVLPNTFMVVRIDGKGFHKFSAAHDFEKPNDPRALELMNHAARHVMRELKGEVLLAFGESDEYSFLLGRRCGLYNRRSSKIATHIVSMFTAAYVFHWNAFFPDMSLRQLPSFDSRLVAYPGVQEVRDYFAWRQVDTHINNLYNTTFWALVLQGGQNETEATKSLQGTVSGDKHEILFGRFKINYDKLPAMYRKGTTILWAPVPASKDVLPQAEPTGASPSSASQGQAGATGRTTLPKSKKKELRTLHVDIIGDNFWQVPAAPPLAAAEAHHLESEPWSDPRRLDPNVTAAGLLD